MPTAAVRSRKEDIRSFSGELDLRAKWRDAYRRVRAETEKRVAKLSPEDQVIQSMPDASPAKWHRAHTTWFFEQFILVPNLRSYRLFDERFAFLFNSYYVSAGPRHARPQRGLITRPSVSNVAAYRVHVDAAMEKLIAEIDDDKLGQLIHLIELGLNHEQQHQELLITDILHAFAQNPTAPIYDTAWRAPRSVSKKEFVKLAEGIHTIGFEGNGFCFDNEGPAHRELIGPVSIAQSLVTNAEWLAFMRDGGYTTPSLWLSDGWATLEQERWTAPGYWRESDGQWYSFTLAGLQPIDPSAPVCHVSYYEADAFARWSGKHLPTEMEWEVAARAGIISDAFGIVWQWTRSSYSPYPAYVPQPGAIGEYNGKFMINQMVLRGSSLATPEGHSRITYRNFFYPPSRWQFTGLRLVDYRA